MGVDVSFLLYDASGELDSGIPNSIVVEIGNIFNEPVSHDFMMQGFTERLPEFVIEAQRKLAEYTHEDKYMLNSVRRYLRAMIVAAKKADTILILSDGTDIDTDELFE